MAVIQIFVAALLLLAVPTVVGSLFGRNVDKGGRSLIFRWISGQILLWACFQFICVPMILMEVDFIYVVYVYGGMTAVILLAAGALLVKNKKASWAVARIEGFDRKRLGEHIFWLIFWVLLAFQLIQAVRLVYSDGDDAFFVAISSITQDANTMYNKLPYTGYATQLDVRHGLAPFPIWIAYLAKLVGIHSASMAHVVLPVVLIPMTYGIFYLLGRVLLPEKSEKLPLFMIFTELLVLFGDYSLYTVENFMIARSRQGKAALGSIIIPMTIYLLLILLRQIQEGEKISFKYYVLLASAGMAGCLCSTMGAMLCCMLVGIVGLCAAAVYKRRNLLIPLALCCLPNVCYVALYFLLGRYYVE